MKEEIKHAKYVSQLPMFNCSDSEAMKILRKKQPSPKYTIDTGEIIYIAQGNGKTRIFERPEYGGRLGSQVKPMGSRLHTLERM